MDDPEFDDGLVDVQEAQVQDSVLTSTAGINDDDGDDGPPPVLNVSTPVMRYSLPELLYRRQSLGNNHNSLNANLSLTSIGRRSFPPLPRIAQQQDGAPTQTDDDDDDDDVSNDGVDVLQVPCSDGEDRRPPAPSSSSSSSSSFSKSSSLSSEQEQPQSFQPVPTPYLSYRGAWNPTRLQNTILVVGPGTPASVLWNAKPRSPVVDKDDEGAGDEDEDEEMECSGPEASAVFTAPPNTPSASTTTTTRDSSAAATATAGSRRSRWVLKNDDQSHNENSGSSEEDVDGRDDDHHDEDDNDNDGSPQDRLSQLRRRHLRDILDNVGDAAMSGVYQLMDTDDEDDNDDDEDDGDESDHKSEDEEDVSDGDEDEDEDDDDDDLFSLHHLPSWRDDDSDEDVNDDDDDEDEHPFRRRGGHRGTKINSYFPSMRHAGCINTAHWLDCGWRLSTYTEDINIPPVVKGIFTEECPTQAVTSGDDYKIKFWDLSDAMGTVSPLPGGRSTICPFSASTPTFEEANQLEEAWAGTLSMHTGQITRNYIGQYDHRRHLPGSVRLLTSVHSGHHGNVFHVTPCKGKPGKVATCAADGFLRLVDIEMNQSSPILSPEYDDEMGLLPPRFLSFRSAICFSHHFLNENVGLLCSERGLRQFDLRLPPREQPQQRLLGGSLFRSCKACAILSSSPNPSSFDQGDPTYFFAGGSSPSVALCDIRKTDGGPKSSVLQYYRPSGFSAVEDVSVSGLDVSKDGKELLVSYESDQIYTFPVFPNSKTPNSSTSDCINELILQNDADQKTDPESSQGHQDGNDKRTSSPSRQRPSFSFSRKRRHKRKPLKELAAYGGHLNRFTFLKNARYAGPRDEYICTGSDSGNAWIYDKSTGGVVSFLKADNSTCNGIVPHPSLPVFVTYGIDSTAKLWRSTISVDPTTDDSAVGRRRHAKNSDKYCMSAVVSDWNKIQSILLSLEPNDMSVLQTDLYPDQIPSLLRTAIRRLSRANWMRRAYSSMMSGKAPGIGNNLHNLPQILEENLFACLQSMFDDSDIPVESDVEMLKHRMSLIRLQHQADRLGLRWDPYRPWWMELINASGTDIMMDKSLCSEPSDLVPDYPSDWIPYDPRLSTKVSFDFKDYFNREDYLDFFLDRYGPLDEIGSIRSHDKVDTSRKRKNARMTTTPTNGNEASGSNVSTKNEAFQTALFEIMEILKDGGNSALAAGDLDLAATRYDKAIKYGAIHFMTFSAETSPNLIKGSLNERSTTGSLEHATDESQATRWTPILRTMVNCRLNLSFVLLQPQFGLGQADVAMSQAELALKDLVSVTEFEVRQKAQSDSSHLKPPAKCINEALSLQAKAYYRLGCAQYEHSKFRYAVESFEASILSTQLVGDGTIEPDPIVVRRLGEAKREYTSRTKRRRKKFKFASSGAPDSPLATSTPGPLPTTFTTTPTFSVNSALLGETSTATAGINAVPAVTPGTVGACNCHGNDDNNNQESSQEDEDDDMNIAEGEKKDEEKINCNSTISDNLSTAFAHSGQGDGGKKPVLPHSNTM
eukprot:CAMPEP_0113485942 /NCGR_PEP_ID=MMETSP0014_2-20120614/24741_1 /TAXON_ID=2857 /ORGANISM="Nitzschia sp." /LENGTH=1530 /DNA_ID=CAMNT_0000379599 /DNA_START=136 /DNA_END=4728 /DNA_ORIENTATION=+ /assembly_acc=CAM_ASM_000159